MIYEKALELHKKSFEVGFEIVEMALREMSQEELLKIPIIDAYTKVAAERYGYCFSASPKFDYDSYYRMYMVCTMVFRDEKPYRIKITN